MSKKSSSAVTQWTWPMLVLGIGLLLLNPTAWGAEPATKPAAKTPATQPSPAKSEPPAKDQSPAEDSSSKDAKDQPLSPGEAKVQAEAKLRKKLQEVISVSFDEVPLRKALAQLKTEHGVGIQLDSRALEEIGVDPDDPVTLNLKDVQLGSALHNMLRYLQLTYMLDEEWILVTTLEVVESSLKTRVFPVDDLVQYRDDQGNTVDDGERLADIIVNCVQMNTWDHVGGPGSLEIHDRQLIVSQTGYVLEEIESLLASLRVLPHFQSPEAGQRTKPVALDQQDEFSPKFQEALAQRISVDFAETPLEEVASSLAKKIGINVQLDIRSLNDVGVGTDTPVTVSVDEVTARSLLRLMLRPLALTYTIQDEVLLITTPEVVESYLPYMLYPVQDLLALPNRPEEEDVEAEYEELSDLLQSLIAPNTWDQVGGPGVLRAYPQRGSFLVANTSDVLEEMDLVLARMRQVKREQPAPAEDVKNRLDEVVVVVYELMYPQPNPEKKDGPQPPEPEHIDTEQLALVLPTLLQEVTWDKANGVSIHGLTDRLVVRHNRRVHRQVFDLLNQMGVGVVSRDPTAPLMQGVGIGMGGFSGGMGSGAGFFNLQKR